MDEQRNASTERPEAAPGCFVCLNVRPMLRNMWSEETRGHFRNSRIEFLKAIRSMIDDRINRLSRRESRGTTVTVE